MAHIRCQENQPINLKKILEELGYLKFYRTSLGFRASELDVERKAISKFIRKNKEYLDFLGIELETAENPRAKHYAGIVPLEFAVAEKTKANLIIEPMIRHDMLSHFASITSHRDWLKTNPDWPVSRRLEIELWHFSKPFINECLEVLERPARGFKTIISNDQQPKGVTDWTDFAINRKPFYSFEFTNYFPKLTLDVLPHALIKWCIQVIRSSVKYPSAATYYLLDQLQVIESLLGNDVIAAVPTQQNIARLPQTGAWSGYQSLYREISHIAKLSGVLDEIYDPEFGCAYSIDSAKLFETFTAFICEKFASKYGFQFFKDSDDSSRIRLERVHESGKFKMMKSLRPDIVLRNEDTLIVIDAKYKHHFDLATNYQSTDLWYDELRKDVHQVLSYGIFSDRRKKIFLLTHPKLGTKKNQFELWRVSKNPNNLIGFLPLTFEKDADLDSTITNYHNSLNKIIAEINRL